jgi:hypothetical protein
MDAWMAYGWPMDGLWMPGWPMDGLIWMAYGCLDDLWMPGWPMDGLWMADVILDLVTRSWASDGNLRTSQWPSVDDQNRLMSLNVLMEVFCSYRVPVKTVSDVSVSSLLLL